MPVAALVLTLSIGSVAFAMNGAAGSQTVAGAAAATTTTAATAAKDTATSTTRDTSAVVVAVRADASTTTTTAPAPPALILLALDQAKEDASLDLIRQKMTATDQATLDKLRATAATQQADVQQAQAALASTTAQITALIDTYLGISTTTSTTGS